MSVKTKKLALMAVGIALFVVLSLCLQVPVFENYYLCLGYVVMAVYCCSFGTLAGTVVGFFGVILYCVVISGLRGMPGWALGNIVIGLALGLCFQATRKMGNQVLRTVLQVASIVASVAVGILVVKSETEALLYAQPFLVRAAKNSYAFVADVTVLIASLPVCAILDKQVKKMFKQDNPEISKIAEQKSREQESEDLLSQIPEELRRCLPDTDKILLTKNYDFEKTPSVSYCEKTENGQTHGHEIFAQSYHPFIRQYSSNLAQISESLLEYMSYSPLSYQVSAFELDVQLSASYWGASYHETAEHMQFYERFQESQHDGGGSSSLTWKLFKTEETEPQAPLFQDKEYKQLRMPPCKGFWIKAGHCYIVDPWSIPGVFEFYMRSTYQEGSFSDEEINEVGW